MGIAVRGHEGGEVTLALALSALRECTDPAAVVEDAREWSRYVAVVDRRPAAVREFADEHGVDWEFDLEGDKWQTMEQVRTTVPSPRYVFVGVTDEDRTVAMHLDWEFLRVEVAAEKAGWELERNGSAGFRDRLAGLWPF